jgi:hypothetical protein
MTLSRLPVAVLVTAAIGILLSGCMTSKEPKFPASSAVALFGDGGKFKVYDRGEGDQYIENDDAEIRKRADGGYDFVMQGNDPNVVTVHKIDGDLYVVQSKKKHAEAYDYLLIRAAGSEYFTYAPDCSKQDKAKMAGVEIKKDECHIDRVADPVKFLAALDRGEPTAKLVKQ